MKTWVKNDVKSENLTFFTARSPAVSRGDSPGTVVDGPMGDDRAEPHRVRQNG